LISESEDGDQCQLDAAEGGQSSDGFSAPQAPGDAGALKLASRPPPVAALTFAFVNFQRRSKGVAGGGTRQAWQREEAEDEANDFHDADFSGCRRERRDLRLCGAGISQAGRC
jgi:hypothetical protein